MKIEEIEGVGPAHAAKLECGPRRGRRITCSSAAASPAGREALFGPDGIGARAHPGVGQPRRPDAHQRRRLRVRRPARGRGRRLRCPSSPSATRRTSPPPSRRDEREQEARPPRAQPRPAVNEAWIDRGEDTPKVVTPLRATPARSELRAGPRLSSVTPRRSRPGARGARSCRRPCSTSRRGASAAGTRARVRSSGCGTPRADTGDGRRASGS